MLIVISNCSLLNPGPKVKSIDESGISTFYQNVHGLLTYSSLGSKYPVLNITKVLELQSYIASYRPDILILNKTWLKPAINDAEIIPNDYKIFRLDRCPKSHPPDPINRNKFKVNGGGILIAVHNNLDMRPKVLKSNSKAEILSITLKLKNNKKICIMTYYRVGMLGQSNLSEISNHFQQIASMKSIISHTFIGVMNLDSVDWTENSSNIPLHNDFLSLFDSLNLTQLINAPTHY